MRLAPETFRAAGVSWQLFVVLTWRGEPPRAESRERALRKFLRQVARRCRVPFDRLLWLGRDGDPGPVKRPHWHVLIGGLPVVSLGLDLGCDLALYWFTKGAAKVRLWNEALGGFVYSTKTGANAFEYGEFDQSVPIIASASLRKLVPFLTGGYCEAEDAGSLEKPERVTVRGVDGEQGYDQQPLERMTIAGLTVIGPDQDIRYFGPRISSVTGDYLVAAKCSRTSCELFPRAAITG